MQRMPRETRLKLFNNPYVQRRIEKKELLRSHTTNPYANNSRKNICVEGFLSSHSNMQEPDEKAIFVVAGRCKFLRLMGKASFLKLQDESGVLQAYYAKNTIGEDAFNLLKKTLEVGDIVEIEGYAFVTKTGELSIHASSVRILTKSISPLPEKFHGLVDKELRYRQRYLDLIMNPEVKETFILRSKIISSIRHFFENKGFLEVETPMLHPTAGGANAKPFITRHNALGEDRYLRIAPELYLKRLIVGGFEAVYELNRNFRNEGMDLTHNPEFSMIEFYWAYKTYEDLIDLTKEFFAFLLETLGLDKIVDFGEKKIDFSSFERYTYDEALLKFGNIAKDAINDHEKLTQIAASHNIKKPMDLGRLKEQLFDILVEDKLINPTFITDFPIEISPLARRNDKNPSIADRFELFIAGKEIANGFSELNDPIDQFKRFELQLQAKKDGDDEAHQMDEEYIHALSYGMPPTAGQGIGIDRLIMLLTNNTSIRDVLLFPAMRLEK